MELRHNSPTLAGGQFAPVPMAQCLIPCHRLAQLNLLPSYLEGVVHAPHFEREVTLDIAQALAHLFQFLGR